MIQFLRGDLQNMKLKRIQVTLISAILIRLVVLMIIVLCADRIPAFGLSGNNPYNDDYRYEQGGVLYSQSAEHIIDKTVFRNTFDSFGDWVGHQNWIAGTPLWYWISCIAIYITKCRWVLRFINILFFTLTIWCVYEIVRIVHSEKSAMIAAKCLSYLPYFVIFPCFSYKDCMVSFFTFYILLQAVRKKHLERFKFGFSTILLTILSAVGILSTRGGLSVIFLVLAVIYVYAGIIKEHMNAKHIFAIIMLCIVGAIIIYRSYGAILLKFKAYISESDITADMGLGRYLKVNKISDIWKLPLSFFASCILPIGLPQRVSTWIDIVRIGNYAMLPIAVGALFYIALCKKKDGDLFRVCGGYYLITIISSILIYRHIFSLLPIPIMAFSIFWEKANSKNKVIVMCLSAAAMSVLIFI